MHLIKNNSITIFYKTYMITTLLTFGLSRTNYSIVNVNNHYNFIIDVWDLLFDDKSKHKLIEKIRVDIGVSFYNDFKEYCINKLSIEHDLIKYLK